VRTRVKICGITCVEDALRAAELGADALGFVFAQSPRQVTPEQAAEIAARLPPFVSRVGVFVNESPQRIKEIVARCALGAVQLHGDEPAEVLEELGRVVVVRALRLRGEEDLELIDAWPQPWVLIEPFSPEARGGTGKELDLNLAARACQRGKRIILAGGLSPENVGQAVRRVRPYAVDVSSGVEAAPGRKDPHKLARFFAAVREADGAPLSA